MKGSLSVNLFVVFLNWLRLNTDASVCRGGIPVFGVDLVIAVCYTNTSSKAHANFSPLNHVNWCRSLWWRHLVLRRCWYPAFVHDRAICCDPQDEVITIAKLDLLLLFLPLSNYTLGLFKPKKYHYISINPIDVLSRSKQIFRIY